MPPRIQQSAIKSTGGKSERRQPPSMRQASRSGRDVEMSSPPPESPPTETREHLSRRVTVVKPPPKPEGDVSHLSYICSIFLLRCPSTAILAWMAESSSSAICAPARYALINDLFSRFLLRSWQARGTGLRVPHVISIIIPGLALNTL